MFIKGREKIRQEITVGNDGVLDKKDRDSLFSHTCVLGKAIAGEL